MKLKNKSCKNIIIDLIFTGLITVFLISAGTIFIVNFRPLYYFDISFLNIDETSGMSESEIIENYDVLIDYNSPFYEGELEFPTLTSSENGLEHFKEVKELFMNIYLATLITGVLLVPTFIYEAKQDNTWKFLRNSSIFSIVFTITIALVIGINFNKIFILFHKLVFNNNYWIFYSYKDPIITILPDTFFLHCALGILLFVITGSIIQYLFYRHKNKKVQDLT